MLDRLRAVRLLRGWRGAAPADEEAVVEAVLQVGGKGGLMMALADRVAELDVNPLIVGTRGAVAVDARIVLQAIVPQAIVPQAIVSQAIVPHAIVSQDWA